MVFGLGKQTVNRFFENENFEVILFSEFQNFGSAATANGQKVEKVTNSNPDCRFLCPKSTNY